MSFFISGINIKKDKLVLRGFSLMENFQRYFELMTFKKTLGDFNYFPDIVVTSRTISIINISLLLKEI